MKSNNKKLILISAMIMIVAIFYTTTTNRVKNSSKPIKKYDELMLYDFKNNYPTNAYDVIQANSEILKYLYGDEIKEAEVDSLITLQRNLFANKLLELNEQSDQIKTVKEEIKDNRENKVKIIDVVNHTQEYNGDNYSICTINSLQYMTKGGSIYRTYTLIKEKNHWKIFNWKDSLEGFLSIEEIMSN